MQIGSVTRTRNCKLEAREERDAVVTITRGVGKKGCCASNNKRRGNEGMLCQQ